MTCVFSVVPLLMKYVLVLNESIIILYPLFLANIFIYLYDNQYFHHFLLLFKHILSVFVLFLVIIGSISYGSIRKKHTNVQNISSDNCENESIDIIKQQQKVATITHISEVSTSHQIDNCCEHLPEVSVIISNDFPLDEKLSKRSSRQLICYCDGSYSYVNQIGYSGFRASNGFSKYRSCHLRRPRNGSTESEVFAACLALQYTAKHRYDRLILYTDNSKVEQLLKRPKEKDYNDYPKFFKVLKQCHERNDDFAIRVERVRGHPTWYEQQQCSIKGEFAKVDKKVRQKRRRHERRCYFKNNASDPSHITYRCDGRYIQVIHPEKFGTTLIITSSRRAPSPFGILKNN